MINYLDLIQRMKANMMVQLRSKRQELDLLNDFNLNHKISKEEGDDNKGMKVWVRRKA